MRKTSEKYRLNSYDGESLPFENYIKIDNTTLAPDEVAGNCEISFRGGMKTSHRATIAIAILKDYWNLGIGSAMFEELVAAAQNRGTEIMELEFIEGNDRARHLYEKFGFRVVSEKPNAFKLKDGTYRNEFYMQKYL